MNDKKYHPPRIAHRFLLWFLKDELAEEVVGDLEEQFYATLQENTLLKAQWAFCFQVMHYMRPFAIRTMIPKSLNPFFMWRHNLKLSLRNFRKHKSSFLINLLGLSTGIACALLIYMWAMDELKMDKFHEKDARLFQVLLNEEEPDGIYTYESTPGLLAQSLREEMPEVEFASAVITEEWFDSKGILTVKDQSYKAGAWFAEKRLC